MNQEPVPVTGVWLQKATAREGSGHNGELRVLVEVDGQWRQVIEDIADGGPISHSVRPSGILSSPVVEF